MPIVTMVGSRSTPVEICEQITRIAKYLAGRNWILRSGGADGADSAAERGFVDCLDRAEIYLPWARFNGNKSILCSPSIEAYKIAATIHPAWSKLPNSVQSLHARNCHQVLGKKLDTPSDLFICYTENGELKGGTRTAILLAQNNKVPYFNLGNIDFSKEKLLETIKSLESTIE